MIDEHGLQQHQQQLPELSNLAGARLLDCPDVPCQRWKYRKDRLIVAGEDLPFDKRKYSVDLISEATAKAFVTTHHYSGSYPAAVVRVGLFGQSAELLGVAVFSVPINERVIPAHCGVPPRAGLELGRLVLLDSDQAPRNSETFFLKKAFSALRMEKPDLKAVVSYCDPVPRVAMDGSIRLKGHVGTVYQGGNARYVGRASPRTLHMLHDGTILSPRTLSKIRLGETGSDAAERELERLGAGRRPCSMPHHEWVRSFLGGPMVRRLRHPGNHVYLFPLGKGKARGRIESSFSQAMAYPKQVDQVGATC